MLFSQRRGLKPASKAIQFDSLDEDLRNSLWSVLCESVLNYWEPVPQAWELRDRRVEARTVEAIVEAIWFNLLKLPIDSIPRFDSSRGPYQTLREIVLSGPWNETLDLIEFVAHQAPINWRASLIERTNVVLERESSAYRFVGGEVSEITAPVEIAEIESAIQKSVRVVQVHLSAALAKLSDRKSPDYRNSIKESILAVEAMCQALTKQPKATLGDCLKTLKKSKSLHPAFEQALDKLYGYTNDSGGIRHALTEGSAHPTLADAKFMLVACSAFTNYLLTVAAETGIKL